jgi:dipeptidyl aminopeptidase/acylaminoacyl peptidase
MPAGGTGGASEPRRVCEVPNGASSLAWSPDGARLAFLSLDGPEPSSEPKVNEAVRHQRVWTVRPEHDTPQPVTPAGLTVWTYSWSPDGTRMAVYYTDSPAETDWYRGQVGVVSAAGGAIYPLTHLTRQADALNWTRDGTQVVYISGEWSDRGLIGGDVFVVDADGGGEPRNLTPGIECSPSWLTALPEGGGFLFAASNGLTCSAGILNTANGSATLLAPDFYLGERFQPRLSSSSDLRRFAATHSNQSVVGDVYLGEIAGDRASITWRRLTHFNALLEATLELAPSRRISYEGADGWRIEALFTPPLHPTEGELPPLITYVHGGPTSAYRDSWGDLVTQRYAAAGYAVLRPNPRGSIGRGVAFADAVLGDMGGRDFQDILAGVDYVIAQGWADPDRVGIQGWSYGGFMAAWAVSQTDRFKAALMGAGVCDFASFHAQSNIPDWDMRIIGAAPTENPGAYHAHSALHFASRITTPTLICHGENDPSVPVNQAYAFHRALRERGVDVELAIYPREGHGFRERDHNRDLAERSLRWFGRYLKNRPVA